MKSFEEYISERDEEKFDETLNEDVASIIMTSLALPSIAAVAAWGASIVLVSYASLLGKISGKIVRIWKGAAGNVKANYNGETIDKNLKEMNKDAAIRKMKEETEKDRRIFSEELSHVYTSIEEKNFDKAKKDFAAVAKDIQNNPDVHKVLISEISKSLQEPPLYIFSPGNKSYQAIKKVINIRVARAAALATKIGIEKEMNKKEVEKMETEVERK